MARGGLIPFSGSFNRRIAEPLDDYRVATKADLLLASTWTAGDNGVYTFLGMFAIVYADGTNNGGYILTAADYTVAGNWLKVGSSVDLSNYVTKTSLFKDGLIKAELLPDIQTGIIEVLVFDSNHEEILDASDNDIVYDTTDKLLFTWLGDAWSAGQSPVEGFLYMRKDNNVVYKWTGSDLEATSSPLPYASPTSTYQGTSTTQVVSPFSLLSAFKAWVANLQFTAFTTVQKTIQGAINELKTALGTKMTESEFVGGTASRSVQYSVHADFADTAGTASDAISAQFAQQSETAYKDHNGNVIDEEYVHVGEKGANNGIATLDANQRINQSVPTTKLVGLIDTSNLPGFVDDVLNVQYWQGGLPDNPQESDLWFDTGDVSLWVYYLSEWLDVTPEMGKIYIAIQTETSYRWSGSAMVSLSNPLDYATQAEAEAGINNTKVITPLRWLQAFVYNIASYSLASLGNKTLAAAINEKVAIIKMNGETQTMTNNAVDLTVNSIQRNWTNIDATGVNAGKIVLSRNIEVYKLYNTAPTTITIDTSAMDLTKFLKFKLQINQTGYYTITFPQDWLVYGSYYPVEIGEYAYEVTRGYNGQWNVKLEYRNVESLTGTVNEDAGTVIQNKILYVDGENGSDSNTGLSWGEPLLTIQAGINLAIEGDSVFVKGSLTGIKYTNASRTTVVVAMKSGVNVYGGFSGTESTIFEREMVVLQKTLILPSGDRVLNVPLAKYKSIISGDISGNSTYPNSGIGNSATNKADNNQRLVYCNGYATLNGFDLIGAYDDSTTSGTAAFHSAINNGLRVVSCEISNNEFRAGNGGVSKLFFGVGFYLCYLHHNTSVTTYGSFGISRLFHTGSITNCVFESSNNQSLASGNYGDSGSFFSSASITNSYINSCVNIGVASTYPNINAFMYSSNVTSSSISNITVTGGSNHIYSVVYGSTLSNCTITKSSGSFIAQTNCSNCVFMFNYSVSIYGVTATCCTIMNNNNTGASSATLINCSVVRNLVSSGTAGTINCVLTNTVVYGNKISAGVASNVSNTNSSVETYSAFENETRAGTGNINLSLNNTGDANSPYFTSLSADAGVVDLGYQSNPDLLAGSALINVGSDAATTPEYDVKYRPRKVGTIDIGAYEKQ